jgi:hypothetical protein
MNYCSISDAWGSNNNSQQTNIMQLGSVQPHNNIESNMTDINHDSTIKEVYNTPLIEQFKPHSEKKFSKVKKQMSCDDIFEHVNNCRYCNEKMRLKYKSNYNLIQNFTQNNKDTYILILVAIFIYLFFKLLNKL